MVFFMWCKIDEEERLDTISSIELEIERDKSRTEKLKNEFIKTVKYDYGEEIKTNPNGAKLISNGFWYKIKKSINKFFDMF